MGETRTADTDQGTHGDDGGDVHIKWTDVEWTHRQYMAFLSLLFTPRPASPEAKNTDRPAQTL